MTYKDFYTLLGEAAQTGSKETYIAEWATSSLFDPDPDGPGPDYDVVVAELGNIWDLAHMTVRDLLGAAGLTQTALAARFCIPLRTVQNWSTGARECPIYVRLMMADLLGLVTVERS